MTREKILLWFIACCIVAISCISVLSLEAIIMQGGGDNNHNANNNNLLPKNRSGWSIQQPKPVQPLVLITEGCSGSTFLIKFAHDLIARHTEYNPKPFDFGIIEDLEFLSTGKKDTPNMRYNYKLAAIDPFDADKTMVFDTYYNYFHNNKYHRKKHPHKPGIMVPKVLIEQLTDGVAFALQELGAKVVMTYRRNILDLWICRVRDCFAHPMDGTAVFENGTQAKLCFQRRKKPEVKTFAKINSEKFSTIAQDAISQWGCSEYLEHYETKQIIQSKLGLEPQDYPQIAAESLIAFETEPMYSAKFNQSLSDWREFLRGWDIVPKDSIILDEMHKMGIGTRPGTSAAKNLYNVHEIQSMLEKISHPASSKQQQQQQQQDCNLSWMVT